MSKESPTKKTAKKASKPKATKSKEEKVKKTTKPAAKKTTATKSAAAKKTTTTKKVTVKKPTAAKTTAKKSTTKKTVAKAAPKKTNTAKKPAAKKTVAKKPAVKASSKSVSKVTTQTTKKVAKKPAKKSNVSKAPAKKVINAAKPAPQVTSGSNDGSSSFTKALVIVATIVVIVSLYFLLATPSSVKPEPKEITAHQASEQLAFIGGDFELIDTSGNVFKSDYLKGKPHLVYFGFTYCPDICPAQLSKMTEVINVMDKYQKDITPVFITVDPDRDNPDLMKSYIANFHNKFIGLTGSNEQVRKAADAYKVYFETDLESDNGNNDYFLNHTSFIYLMDKNGKYIKHFDLEMSADEIVEFIRVNLK